MPWVFHEKHDMACARGLDAGEVKVHGAAGGGAPALQVRWHSAGLAIVDGFAWRGGIQGSCGSRHRCRAGPPLPAREREDASQRSSETGPVELVHCGGVGGAQRPKVNGAAGGGAPALQGRWHPGALGQPAPL